MADKPTRGTASKKPKRTTAKRTAQSSAPKVAGAAAKPRIKTAPAVASAPAPVPAPPSPPAAAPVAEAPAASPPAPAPKPAVSHVDAEKAIVKAAQALTDKLVADPRINYVLFGFNRNELGKHHHAFLQLALKPQPLEEGHDLHKSFKALFEKGLKNAHFDIMFDHLKQSLRQLDVPSDWSETLLKGSEKIRKTLHSK